ERGGRLREAGILAVGWLGGGSRARLGSATLLVLPGPRVVDFYAVRTAPAQSGRAGLPCQLLRGRCFRQMGRQTAADRGGVGGCGGRPADRRKLRGPASFPALPRRRRD